MIAGFISFLKCAFLPPIQKLMNDQIEKFYCRNQKQELHRSWNEFFKKVVLNAGISEKRFKEAKCSKTISNFLFQSIIKGYSFSNKDIVLILAKENCWGLSSADIIVLATTFCNSLRHSIKKVSRDDLFIDEVYIPFDLSVPAFVKKINSFSSLNKEYYNHFSKRVQSEFSSDMGINVHFRDEMGVNNRTSNYSVNLSINRFDVSEICSAFFTEDADFVIYRGNVREQVKFVHMDKKGNVRIVLESGASYGTCSKKYSTIWEL
ncbi:hypothetical protein ACFFH2_09055 [Enterococcus devriesei]|uniref:Uncharacterized protein n=1 Tax=Enterococcus devriesei TaxID=319970 RepID=A0A1L8SPX0_9ENTE|nr:hypothetical protein [Enterococcus devriesei]OJG34081.1 hypothetical protein RV00_GL000893 [Enterococcus devriesei]